MMVIIIIITITTTIIIIIIIIDDASSSCNGSYHEDHHDDDDEVGYKAVHEEKEKAYLSPSRVVACLCEIFSYHLLQKLGDLVYNDTDWAPLNN